MLKNNTKIKSRKYTGKTVVLYFLITFAIITSTFFGLSLKCKEEEKSFKKINVIQLDHEVEQKNSTLAVAINIITEQPRNPANLVALLHNVASNIPLDWPIQIFTTSRSHPYILRSPAIKKLIMMDRLILQQVPESHDNLGKRELLLSPWMWSACLHQKVFVFDGTSALCGNSPSSVSDFVSYDWIGAAWKWAKPGSPHEFGGNGALSIRNRDLILQVLHANMKEQSKEETNGSIESREGRYAVFQGNEDMWYVKKLFDMKQGTSERQEKTSTDKMNSKHVLINLAPRNVSMSFAVEELYDENEPIPPGVYHTMRSMTDKLREKVLSQCPEAKRLFSVKHENGK